VSLGIDHSEPGYCNRAVIAHEMSAVTGACLVTWKHLYEKLGGLNEGLAVGFNDVDYCLRIQEAGYRVIFTPHAELFHHESATRGRDDHILNWRRNSREVKYIRSRWSDRIRHDPYYNINLSYRRPDFSLSEAPRIKKPWML
jgi:GT2 family glycosyltransferase